MYIHRKSLPAIKHAEVLILSARYDLKDRKFLLNQLKSGLGFVNQSIAVSRHLNHPTMSDRLSGAARTLQSAIVVAEDESAWELLACHGYTSETETAEAASAAARAGCTETTAAATPATVGAVIAE